MKYLKFFESTDDIFNELDISKEDVELLFIDFNDLGFEVEVTGKRMLYQFDVTGIPKISREGLNLGLEPLILVKVRMRRGGFAGSEKWNQIVSEIRERLEHLGFIISKINIHGSSTIADFFIRKINI